MDDVRRMISEAMAEVKRVVVNCHRIINLLFAALIAGGHVLLEDEPGTGKTHLARSLAKALGLEFNRIQFTPDTRPSDIIGVNVWDEQKKEFKFRPGPIFANIVLADEINRASPKTQAALLEAMQEGRVTVDGVTHDLPRPFMVIATENPLDHDGTSPLPEAQIDRFLFRLEMEDLTPDQEAEMLMGTELGTPEVNPVTRFDWNRIRKEYERIHVEPSLFRYAADLQQAARSGKEIRLGKTGRGGQALIWGAKALSTIDGSAYITVEQIDSLLYDTLNHRLHMPYGSSVEKVREFTSALPKHVLAPELSVEELIEAAFNKRN